MYWPVSRIASTHAISLYGFAPCEAGRRRGCAGFARFVKGNTDQYLIDDSDDEQEVAFARRQLSEAEIAFVRDLPFEQRLEVAPGHELLVVHANPRDLEGQIRPDSSDEMIRPMLLGVTSEVVAFGHYQVPFVRQLDHWTLVDVASVGMPRDGDQRAVYAVLDWEQGAWRIKHRRVAFDIQAVARDYAAVGFSGAAQAARRLLKASYS